MASILRFARHGRRFSQLSSAKRIISFSKYNAAKRNIVLQHSPNQIRSLATQNVSAARIRTEYHKVDDTLNKLDMAARRMGRISLKDVEQLFHDLKTSGKVTPNQSLLAVHCCGKLLPDETLETRSKLATSIWTALEGNGCVFDVSHYNVLLKVHLENEYNFNPTDFLAQMEAKNVAPNRVTYQRLISRYCQLGDIEGAGRILEFMKKKELTINENVFNALIMGHARSNNMEAAKGVLDLMRNSKIEPSADSYAALLYAYAEKGDIENIRQTIDEIGKRDLFLLDENYLEIIYNLAKNGHSQHVEEMTKLFRKFVGFNQEATPIILKLVNCGQEEVAMQLLNHLSPLVRPDGKPAPTGQFFIRQLVRVDRPIEKIVKVCKDMKASGMNTLALQKATETALTFGKTDTALKLINAMKEEDLPIRNHYFWPILMSLKKQNANESKLYDIFDLMMVYGCPANYASFLDYFYPLINTDDHKVVINKLRDFGYTIGAIVSPLVEFYVTEKKLEKACSLLNEYPIRANVNSLIRPMAVACKQTNNVKTTIELLKRIKEKTDRDTIDRTDIVGQFLMTYCRVVERSVEKTEILAKEMLQNRLQISPEMGDMIRRTLRLDDQNSFSATLKALTSSTIQFTIDDGDTPNFTQPRNMSLNEMENQLAELKAKNMNTRGILRKLLLHYCRVNNLEKALEVKSQLDTEDFVYSGGMMSLLIELYANNDRLEEAMETFQKLKSAQPDFALDQHKLMNLVAAYIRADKVEDAMKILNEEEVNSIDIKRDSSSWRLLNSAADRGDTELTQKLFDIMVKRKFCEPTNIIVGPLVKGYLLKDDIVGATAKFEELCKKFRLTPWRNQLFERLIKADDADRLQKVMDLNSEIHGEMNTMYDLAFSFLNCGRSREAKKIFDSTGLRAKHGRLDPMCERLIEENRVDVLEELVKITRDLFDIDRDRMYFYLLKAFKKENNYKKAQGVWVAMQEEDIRPSERTLIFLADMLKENGQPIPFAVPESKPKPVEETQKGKLTSPILRAITDDNVDKALELKREMESRNGQLTVAEASSLIESLIQKERLNEAVKLTSEMLANKTSPVNAVLRFLLLKLSAAGDVDTIKNLEEKMSGDSKRIVQFSNMLFSAYVNSERISEVLDLLQKDATGARMYAPGGAIQGLLKKYPDKITKVEEIGKEYAKNNMHGVLNNVWTYYFIQEQYDKADEVLKSNPQFQKSLAFRSVLDHAELTGNADMVKRLCEIVKAASIPKQALALVYSSLLDISCAKQSYDAVEATYAEAKKAGVANMIHRSTINKLKAGLTQAGRDKTFLIGTSSSSSENSSSSSDSDSDAELNKKAKQ